MKTQNKIKTILSVACLALIGTGYALWEFSKDATVDATSNVVITDSSESGSLSVDKDTIYLILDQEYVGWSTSNSIDDAITSLALTYLGAEANGTSSNTGWEIDETVTFSCDITNDLSSYITIGNGEFDDNNVAYSGDAVTVNYTLPTISWVSNMKPTNKTEYDTMVTALNSKTVSFAFSAEIA